MNNTDLQLSDVIPIGIARTYRQNDSASRAFGIGASHAYDMFLVGTTVPYTYVDLIMPDGARVHYDRISSGTSYTDAVYEHTSSQTEFYKSTIHWSDSDWILQLKNGTQIRFLEGDTGTRAQQGAATSIRDRYGNQVTLTRDSNANLTRITSPNGRYIDLTYDTSYRVTQATDNIGRTVQYTYDTGGRLATVTDPAAGVTTYTYDTSNRMLTITDARNITYLTNQYDTNGRVVLQTQADSTTYQFAYTLDVDNDVTQTDVTDRRGVVRRVTFDAAGYVSGETRALGETEEQTITYVRQSGTNLLTSVTDALSRQTTYAYDTSGNLTSVTRLAGTSGAVTTTLTYESTFNQLATVTDPLSHTTSFTYDSAGNVVTITDPLSHEVTMAYAANGQPTSTTTAAGTTSLTYANGDLTAITDPLNRTVTRFFDTAGRLLSVTSPSGSLTRTVYDALDRVTSITDPAGGQTSFTYDPNSNVLTLTDALSHTTSFTYNSMDRPTARTDALSRADARVYDANGNLQQLTDRKNQVTGYTYDHLNRLDTITYDDSSTITYSWDAGNRLTQIADSANGTITRTYDLLDRLTEETTPEGTVEYAYDAAGRRTTMSVTGQSDVTYTYDAANRLTTITQGTDVVGFTYDAANRRTSLTLPNSVVVSYGYNAASQLTSLTYALGATTLGNVTYSYDTSGRPTIVGGSWARTGLPAALASASYDAANQIVTRASVSFTHDANGNLTNDGSRTYTWNVRDQLSAVSGSGSATLAYDATGRRRAKTSGGVTTAFLYDGANLVQEQVGSSASANLLTGLAVDETFSRTDSAGERELLADALGSTLALTDGSGAVVTEYTFDPFGATSTGGTSSANPLQFTGRENDGTGLYALRARYYSPALGRFISEDPLGANGGFNLFAYVENSPTFFIDPFGLDKQPGHGPGSKSGGPQTPPMSSSPRGPEMGAAPPGGGADPFPDLNDFGRCVAGAVGTGAISIGIDSIGFLPAGGGIKRMIGNSVGATGWYADRLGHQFVTAIEKSTGIPGLGDTSPHGAIRSALWGGTFVPGPVGEVATGLTVVDDVGTMLGEVIQCR